MVRRSASAFIGSRSFQRAGALALGVIAASGVMLASCSGETAGKTDAAASAASTAETSHAGVATPDAGVQAAILADKLDAHTRKELDEIIQSAVNLPGSTPVTNEGQVEGRIIDLDSQAQTTTSDAAPGIPASSTSAAESTAPKTQAQTPAAKSAQAAGSSEQASSQAPSAPKSPPMTLAQVTARRDLWPAMVKLTKPIQLSASESIPAGTEMGVYELAGANIHLVRGNELFEHPIAGTDFLERTNQYVATLTPEALALTTEALVARPELWPLKVAVTQTLSFQAGKEIKAGSEVTVRTIEGNGVNAYSKDLGDHFQALFHETDVLARARERLKLDEKEREPFFIRAVAAALESTGDAAKDASFAKADTVLVYKFRKGCGRCAAFAPELTAFYERMKPTHPEFEVVFMSEDKNAEDARELVKAEKLPGRVIAFDKKLEAADLAAQVGQLLPLVFVFDRTGKLVTKNHSNGGAPSATDLLAVVEKRLVEKR